MKLKTIFLPGIIWLFISCDLNHMEPEIYKLYIANQGQDHVSVINAYSGELIHNVDVNFIENLGNDAPHFISLDEINGYWFVTLMHSGYLVQFDIMTDTMIDSIYLGDLPALSSVDIQNKKVYVSRMNMPGMGMMAAESNIIQVVTYSDEGLVISDEINICETCDTGIGPHGITLDPDGNNFFTTSVVSDFLFKVNTETNNVINQISLTGADVVPNNTGQLLKPIQCAMGGNEYIFVSCSGGELMDGGEVPGQIQMYNAETLELIDSYGLIGLDNNGFAIDSRPWHIVVDSSKVYVALSGDMMMPLGQGIASFSYDSDGLDLTWHLNDFIDMDDPHGIAISNDGKRLFISDRGNGRLFIFNTETSQLIDDINLSIMNIGSSTTLGGLAIMKSSCIQCD